MISSPAFSTTSSTSSLTDGEGKSTKSKNTYEKNRMNRIAQQIQYLNDILKQSGISCKRSKQAILETTTVYIEQLKEELEKSKRECERLSNQLTLSTTLPTTQPQLFQDGNFLNCNAAFNTLSGFALEELKTFSFFNLTPPEDMQKMFAIVNTMFTDENASPQRFWKECNMKNKKVMVYVAMSLIKNEKKEPQYFHCVVLPLPNKPETFEMPSDSIENLLYLDD